MRMPAMPASMHSRTRRRTAITPPWPVSPSRMTGKFTAPAIHFPTCTHSVMEAVPTSARPVIPPTTADVPTKPASQPVRSMMRPSAAVGGCSTVSTRSLRPRSSRSLLDLLEPGACIEPHCVVPEELALARLGHLPVEDHADRLGEMAFAVRVIGCIHEHVLPDEVDHGVGELLA